MLELAQVQTVLVSLSAVPLLHRDAECAEHDRQADDGQFQYESALAHRACDTVRQHPDFFAMPDLPCLNYLQASATSPCSVRRLVSQMEMTLYTPATLYRLYGHYPPESHRPVPIIAGTFRRC